MQWFSKVYIVQDEVMELICAPEVLDDGAYGFVTVFLYCQTVTSAGLLGAKL